MFSSPIIIRVRYHPKRDNYVIEGDKFKERSQLFSMWRKSMYLGTIKY